MCTYMYFDFLLGRLLRYSKYQAAMKPCAVVNAGTRIGTWLSTDIYVKIQQLKFTCMSEFHLYVVWPPNWIQWIPFFIFHFLFPGVLTSPVRSATPTHCQQAQQQQQIMTRSDSGVSSLSNSSALTPPNSAANNQPINKEKTTSAAAILSLFEQPDGAHESKVG